MIKPRVHGNQIYWGFIISYNLHDGIETCTIIIFIYYIYQSILNFVIFAKPMEYSTETMKINLELLESVLYNAEKDIPKLKISIHFQDKDKHNSFISKVQPIINDDNQFIDSDSISESDDLQQVNIPSTEEISSRDEDEKLLVEKLQNLEQSIILKQFYMEEISKISRITGTRVLIVPQKIKYFGKSYEDIQQAKAQVFEMKKNIRIQRIRNYGREVYESNYYYNKITSANIHLVKIAEKYLSWYDETKINEQKKDDVFEDAFQKYHCMEPLFEAPRENSKKINEKYVTAIIKTKGHLFTKYLAQALNQTYEEEFRIQLSKSENQLIIHCTIKQQSDMRISQIKSLYDNFLYFFINYEQQEVIDELGDNQTERIPNIKKIEDYLQKKSIIFYRHHNLLVVAYQKQYFQANQSIDNQTFMVEQNKKNFIENIAPIFEMNVHCSIEVLIDDVYGIYMTAEETKQQESINKKVIVEDKIYDRLRVVSPKNKKPALFLQILEFYILAPLLKSKSSTKQKVDPVLNSIVNESSIVVDSLINESSTMLLDKDSRIEGHEDNEKNQSFILPPEIKMSKNKHFEKYKRLLPDSKMQKKYNGDQEILEKMKQSDQEFSDLIREQLSIKYKVMNVKIPAKFINHHLNLLKCLNKITVFVKQKDEKYLYSDSDDQIPVYPFEKSKDIQQNGWLINVDKNIVEDRQYQLFIKKNGRNQEADNSQVKSKQEFSYEVFKYLKFIKSF